jgi:hypothetical protein
MHEDEGRCMQRLGVISASAVPSDPLDDGTEVGSGTDLELQGHVTSGSLAASSAQCHWSYTFAAAPPALSSQKPLILL